jgi:hypothetical protein
MKYHGYDFVCKEGRIEFDPEIIALNEIQSGHMLVATQQDGQWILEPLKEPVDFKEQLGDNNGILIKE